MKKAFVILMSLVLIIVSLNITYADSQNTRKIILLTEYQQMGWGETFELGALDSDGNLWTYTNHTRNDIPYDHEGLLAWVESTDQLTSAGKINSSDLSDILSLTNTVAEQEVVTNPVAEDAGSQTSIAIRRDKNGNTEIIVLGCSGDDFYENTDPSAQALYQFLRTSFEQVTDFDGEEGMAPLGFRQTDILSFCGYADIDLSQLTETAYWNDCEAGPSEIKPELSADDIMRMKVTGKKNCMFTTGNTTQYFFTDTDGNTVIAFEFYEGLLVTRDGMYSLVR